MGKPAYVKHMCLYTVGYIEREPCEVKHLSSMRKIKKVAISNIDSLSSGERKGTYLEIYSLPGYASGR